MKYFRITGEKCYTCHVFELIDMETNLTVAKMRVGSLPEKELFQNQLFQIVSQLVKHLYNTDFSLVYDIEKIEI